MHFNVIIPARYASTRLPGKPLIDIGGRPMIQHVYERALASGAHEVVIATDDARVHDAALVFGARVCMTATEHRSGSDRLAQAIEHLGYAADAIVVNVQGDEPLISPRLFRQVAENLAVHSECAVTTLCEPIHTAVELFDPHCVKVVFNQHGHALYFSRAPIPWDRDAFSITTAQLPAHAEHYRHLGIYAYRAGFLQSYVIWPHGLLERMESLEQLRILERGERIHVAVALEKSGPGVDTEADLERVRLVIKCPLPQGQD